jgi:hypothetical protein
MTVLSAIFWWIGTLLLAVIVSRFVWSKRPRTYPLFLTYLVGSLVGSLLLYAVSLRSPMSYPQWYWAIQFLTLILGCGIILEIFRHVLAPYPGAERFATTAGVVIFAAIFCFTLFYSFVVLEGSPATTSFQLERDCRTIQSIFLIGILVVISHYQVAIGKNMKGMIAGYGLYVGMSLVRLAIRSYAGGPFATGWDVMVQQFAYDVSLVVWTASLWSYHPNPVPEPGIRLEADYEAFVAKTRGMMGAMRSHLAKAGRP